MIETSQIRHNISLVSDFLSKNDKHFGLILSGLVGGGKTTIVRAIQNMINNISDNFINIEVNPYSTGTKSTLRIENATSILDVYNSREIRFNELCSTPLLAIDDLGVEPTEQMQYGNIISPICRLLEKRYDLRLFTIITTNLTPPEITSKYGQRIGDRLSEFKYIIFKNDESFRRYDK
ncbi:MAG: hypothetical protein ACI4XS_13575 [Bacillus sp. (in: firmicutes)]